MTTPFPDTPAWVPDSVFYQIFPDRFARSDRVSKDLNLEPWESEPTRHGFKGGDLGGVIEHLDHLTDLGVNAVLLNPIFQSASNHRYHTHDYHRIDPLLGDESLFDEMLEACHARGIRVVLDGVFNHCSRGFFQFNDLLENASQSPYVDWFNVWDFPVRAYHPRRSPNYEAWYDLPALPEFNTESPVVREFLFEVAEFWTRKGIDGWRLDVAHEITTPGFWQEFRRRVRAINPDAYIVSEIWRDSSAWLNDRERFDGTMNYLFTGAVIAFAAGRRVDVSAVAGQPWPVMPPLDAGRYARSVERLLDLYHPQATLGNLNCFSSHDTARILNIVGGDEAAVRLVVLLTMTFPGAAHVYYGEELGMRGHREPSSRNAILWDDRGSWNDDIHRVFRELIALRLAHPALRSLDYRVVAAEGDLFAAERRAGDERLVVLANAAEGEGAVLLDAPPREVLWGEARVADAGVTVLGRSGAILAL